MTSHKLRYIYPPSPMSQSMPYAFCSSVTIWLSPSPSLYLTSFMKGPKGINKVSQPTNLKSIFLLEQNLASMTSSSSGSTSSKRGKRSFEPTFFEMEFEFEFELEFGIWIWRHLPSMSLVSSIFHIEEFVRNRPRSENELIELKSRS